MGQSGGSQQPIRNKCMQSSHLMLSPGKWNRQGVGVGGGGIAPPFVFQTKDNGPAGLHLQLTPDMLILTRSQRAATIAQPGLA